MATPNAPTPNADLDALKAVVNALQRKVKDLEDRPILREEKFIESTPKWLQVVVSVATAVLIPVLGAGAAATYSLHGDVREMKGDVRAVQTTIGELRVAVRDLQQSDQQQAAALGRIEALLTPRPRR